jgi:hypothetical protein
MSSRDDNVPLRNNCQPYTTACPYARMYSGLGQFYL